MQSPYENKKNCPNCDNKLSLILYGLPTQELLDNLPDDVILGGCMLTGDDPVYHCPNCNKDYNDDLSEYIDNEKLDTIINKKLDELFDLLNSSEDIKKIGKLKKKITKKELDLINEYRNNPTVVNKKKLYDNKVINDYLICESNINYLIMEINSKFKRSHNCESNKW